MRILHVLFDGRFGGPQNEVLQVSQAMVQQGVESIVVAPDDDLFSNLLAKAAVEFIPLDLVRLRKSFNPSEHLKLLLEFQPNVRQLERIIRDRAIDVVHTNGFLHLQAAIAARHLGIPLIWRLNDTHSPAPLRTLVAPIVRDWPDRITVHSRAVSTYYFPSEPTVGGRLEVLYPPVNTREFHPEVDGNAVRAELGIAPDTLLIGVVGNVYPAKGFDVMVEAAAEVHQRHPRAVFVVAGALLDNWSSYWKGLRYRCRSLGLGDSVRFLGQRKDIVQIMAALDLYLHPSVSGEAAPLAIMEASASGRAVVATDVGGVNELVEDGVTGRIVPAGDPGAIAKEVAGLLERADVREAMGNAGRKRACERFSLERSCENHMRIYQQVISDDSEPAVSA